MQMVILLSYFDELKETSILSAGELIRIKQYIILFQLMGKVIIVIFPHKQKL